MDFIASPDAATQLWAFDIFLGVWVPNAALNDQLLMQAIAALVSNNHDVVWFPVLTLILGRTFSPGTKTSYNLFRSSVMPGIGLISVEAAPICYPLMV